MTPHEQEAEQLAEKVAVKWTNYAFNHPKKDDGFHPIIFSAIMGALKEVNPPALIEARESKNNSICIHHNDDERVLVRYEYCLVCLAKERDSYRANLDWLNTVEGMDWFSNCDYGEATIDAITDAKTRVDK